jgi:CheY-like chemotaxis protein
LRPIKELANLRKLQEVRVLIVGWKPNSNLFLRSLLAVLGTPAFTRAARTDEALSLLREQGFELVFCTDEAEPLSAAEFTRTVRRDIFTRDPTIPVIVVANAVTAGDLQLLRDAGADDIMCPPISSDAIEKRLDRILLNSRTFITTKSFIGPDRRRARDRVFSGPDLRNEQHTAFCQPPRVRRD